MVVLHNNGMQEVLTTPTGNSFMSNMEQKGNSVGGSLSTNPPLRQVLHIDVSDSLVWNDKSSFIPGFSDLPIEKIDKDIRTMAENVLQAGNDVTGDEQGEKQGTNQGGSSMPPLREVLNCNPPPEEAKMSDDSHNAVLEYVIDIPGDVQLTENAHACQTGMPWEKQENLSGGSDEPPSRGVPTHNNHCDKTIPANTPCLIPPVTNAIQTS
jgi:hypothetical protein